MQCSDWLIFSTFPLLSALFACLYLAEARHNHAQLCTFSGRYTCGPLPRHLGGRINWPPNACTVHACGHCIKAFKSFFLTSDFALLQPTSFLLRYTDGDKATESTTYSCSTPTGTPCECDDGQHCSGSSEYCIIRNCSKPASCNCHMTYMKPELIVLTPDITLTNPDMISIEVCLLNKLAVNATRFRNRRLLEGENAVFQQQNLTLRFDDPILHLPDVGRVILRSQEFEHVFTVPRDLLIKLPFEFLAYKTDIRILYLHPSGRTVTGLLHVTGKSICQLRQCFFCTEVFQHMSCLPVLLQYIIYIIVVVITIALLACIKLLIKCILFLVKTVAFSAIALFKVCKFMARCSLLLGTFIGNFFREIGINGYQFLEMQAQRQENIVNRPMVLLALCFIITAVNADCNNHAILQADLKSCELLQEGKKLCQVFTTAEISLNTLSSESCLWFSDKDNNHLFSLQIKLEAVTCHFNTERMYFTFPVTTKHISQISCIFNEYCGRGVHCIKQRVGKKGLNFEAETPESRSFPGVSGCQPGALGVGCAILTRAACNFYRTWYEPDLLQSYEVSKIRGHTCKYHISVHHKENNTVSKLITSDSAFTSNGIKITVIGAYDQPQLHIDDFFIQRVGRPTEAYLSPASQRNNPKAGEIGAIQANTSYTNDFIFDPQISQCDFFEDSLRCISAHDALQKLRTSQEHALPLQRDIHLFQVRDERLESSLLFSSAIRLQLYFSNFKIAVHARNICPQFREANIEVTGCYNCPILARMTFGAHSTCQSGVVLITFQEIHLHTKAIRLTTEMQEYTIKFSTDKRCLNEKLCLKSSTLVQCKVFKFCLNEPSVELLQLDTNYTRTQSQQTSSKWSDWSFFPNIQHSYFMLKFVGAALFLLCFVITIFSTMITCCCRSR